MDFECFQEIQGWGQSIDNSLLKIIYLARYYSMDMVCYDRDDPSCVEQLFLISLIVHVSWACSVFVFLCTTDIDCSHTFGPSNVYHTVQLRFLSLI